MFQSRRTTLGEQFTPEQREAWKPKIVARNTFAFTRDGETVIRLHDTDIVRKLPDGSVILNSGGFKTTTTRDRMRRYLPGGMLYQQKGEWYLTSADDFSEYSGHKVVPFYDGIRVPQCFEQELPFKVQAKIRREKLLREKIKKFVKKLDKGAIPIPSTGDCLYCQMQIAQGPNKGKAFVDATGSHECIESHIKEGYLHGSLIFNALKWAGYPHPEIFFQIGNRDTMKRALKRYLYSHCGMVV